MTVLELDADLQERIKELVRSKEGELEELWMALVEGEPRSLSFHEKVIRFLLNKKLEERLETLYGLLLDARNKQGRHQQVLDIANLVLEFNPGYDFLRPHLIVAYKALHSDRDRLAEFLKASGLDSESPDIRKAVTRMEELLGASKGQVFRHHQWGLGVVRELDAKENWAVVDFRKKANHRMTLEGLRTFLERVPNDHVLARIARDPEEFKKEMFDDPAAVVRQALKGANGSIKAADLKRLLMDGFLTESEHKRWWNKAKDAIRLDPFVDQKGSGANIVLVLRKEPRSFVDEIQERLLKAVTLAEKRVVLRDVARHGEDAELTEEDRSHLYKLFTFPITSGQVSKPADQFALGALYAEYAALFPANAAPPVDVRAMLADPKFPAAQCIGALGIFETQRAALEILVEVRPDAIVDVFTEVFFEGDSKLAAWMEKKLEASGHPDALTHCIERILARPLRNPQLSCWVARNAIEGRYPHLAESIPPIMVCEELVSVIAQLDDESVRASGGELEVMKAHMARFAAVLQDNQGKLVKKAVRLATTEEARKFLTQVNMSGGLSNQLRETIEQIVFMEHKDLKKVSKQDEEEEKRRPAYHYALGASVEAKRQELSHILNVEIPENSIAIGVARELGDLRENAEYHAAKDRQKLLMQQAAELEELIARARIIEMAEVRTDEVRFGTRVTLRLEDGTIEKYTVMGMWEANMAEKIISYLTPFGSQLLNRRPGEQFVMAHTDGRTSALEVLSIEKAE